MLQAQKYLETPLVTYLGEQYKFIEEVVSERIVLMVVILVLATIMYVAMYLAIWRRLIANLHERLRNTRMILSFIPIRVFVKNSKLVK